MTSPGPEGLTGAAVPIAAQEFYTTLQRFQLLLLSAGRRVWRGMRPADFDGSWQRQVGPQLVAFTAGAQLAAAQAGAAYVPAVLAETRQPDQPLASVRPQAFAGVASDGRPLDSLLEGSVRHAKRAVSNGADAEVALDLGGKWLETALQTIATDAARDTVQAELMVRKRMGYVRLVNPPCCSRCAVLAGKWYSRNDILPRHPNCDCQLIPSLENRADDFRVNPDALLKRGLITDVTKDQRARIDDGANLVKVLNESRDRWRERLAAQRRADKRKRSMWSETSQTPPLGTSLPDIMARLTASVEANRAARLLREAGIAE